MVKFCGYHLIFGRVDKLSMIFGYVLAIMGFLGFIYALHVKDWGEHVAAAFYVGGALGVVYSGDLITLFLFWELMAFSSTYLIWNRRTEASRQAGMRYILVHIVGGLCLMTGIVIHVAQTGSTAFDLMRPDTLATQLILVSFMLNAAVPPLSAWLSDAYPESTITGAVFLCAFTTKTAVYVLIRGFAGTPELMWFGSIMAIYGVIFAVLANDIRRLLAYHIISQVGYMVAGVGMGTFLALNGSAAHAFSNILCKSLLFMGAGAVIYTTGKSKLSELGGIYRYMPVTLSLYMIGAFSISAFPLFSGFVSKSMVVAAAGEIHNVWVWFLLSLSSIGTFLHTGLKLPYFTFFGADSGLRPKEAPVNMLVAMAFACVLNILMGVFPQFFYTLLPYPVEYAPYTPLHVVGTLQMLLLTAFGFFMLQNHLGGEAYISIDTDWIYRKGAAAFVWVLNNPLSRMGASFTRFISALPPLLQSTVVQPWPPSERNVRIGKGEAHKMPGADDGQAEAAEAAQSTPIGIALTGVIIVVLLLLVVLAYTN
jgi:multicomponent Na+:H+ antiporter subunit D